MYPVYKIFNLNVFIRIALFKNIPGSENSESKSNYCCFYEQGGLVPLISGYGLKQLGFYLAFCVGPPFLPLDKLEKLSKR